SPAEEGGAARGASVTPPLAGITPAPQRHRRYPWRGKEACGAGFTPADEGDACAGAPVPPPLAGIKPAPQGHRRYPWLGKEACGVGLTPADEGDACTGAPVPPPLAGPTGKATTTTRPWHPPTGGIDCAPFKPSLM